ncbi:MAG TPA: hypothetical protein VI503_02090 [Gaiellaceae bacterium]|nr:hypothetical protein [Gaiellaceae bacterium]
MSRAISLAASLAAAGTLALVAGGTATAAPAPPADFGQHVAACAQDHLGQRELPPAVTCMHDGTTMTFATPGEMVEHLRQHHG